MLALAEGKMRAMGQLQLCDFHLRLEDIGTQQAVPLAVMDDKVSSLRRLQLRHSCSARSMPCASVAGTAKRVANSSGQ